MTKQVERFLIATLVLASFSTPVFARTCDRNAEEFKTIDQFVLDNLYDLYILLNSAPTVENKHAAHCWMAGKASGIVHAFNRPLTTALAAIEKREGQSIRAEVRENIHNLKSAARAVDLSCQSSEGKDAEMSKVLKEFASSAEKLKNLFRDPCSIF